MTNSLYILAGIVCISLLFLWLNQMRSNSEKENTIDMEIWSPSNELWSDVHNPYNILSIVTEKNGEKKIVDKGSMTFCGIYDHIYVTWENLDEKCVYTTDVVISEQDAKKLKEKQLKTHYWTTLFHLSPNSNGECVVTVDLNDENVRDTVYKVFKGQETHELDQQLQQEFGVNSMEAYFQKKNEMYQQRCFLLDLRQHFSDANIKYATPTDYPVEEVTFKCNWDFPRLNLCRDQGQQLTFPAAVEMEWISLNDKKAFKANYELPISKLMDIFKEIQINTENKNHSTIELFFNFTRNGKANLYMRLDSLQLLVDTDIQGRETDTYDEESIENKIDHFERGNNENNCYQKEREQSFYPILALCDTQRYNYAVKFNTAIKSTLSFVNGEKCRSSKKRNDGFPLLQEIVMKKGEQAYCFDWEETISIFNKAYGKDKSQPGVLNLSLAKDNSLNAELVVNGKNYPFKPISPSYSNRNMAEDEDEGRIFWGAFYTSPRYHPVKILRSRFMGNIWKNTSILNESRDLMASYCIHVPKRWKRSSEIPTMFDLYWISYPERKIYHTHGIIPESVKKELGKDMKKDRFDLIHIRCLPEGKIDLFMDEDGRNALLHETAYTTRETHSLDAAILEESGHSSMKDFFDQADKELPAMDYVKKNGIITSLVNTCNKTYNYQTKIVLEGCDKKSYTPRYMMQYSNLCYENRIPEEYQEETNHSVPQLFKLWMNTSEYRYFFELVFKEEEIFDLFDKAYKGKEDALGELHIHLDGLKETAEVQLIVDNKAYPLSTYYFCNKWALATIKDDNKPCIIVADDQDFKGDLREIRRGLFVGM